MCRIKFRVTALSAVILSCATCAAMGAESVIPKAMTLIENITVSATRTEKSVDDVPATVSVFNARMIEDNLVTDIKDLVRFEPGVAVTSSPARFAAAGSSVGRDGNSGFNIRGLEGNRTLILTDGIRVPDAFSFGAQATGRGDYVDLDVLKSVEILRGPASALYGSDGLAGAVSFVTKDPDDILRTGEQWSVRARGGFSSADDGFAGSLTTAARVGDWQGLLALTRRAGSEQQTSGTNDAKNVTRTTAVPQDIDANAVLAKIVYEWNGANRLRLTVDHYRRHVDSDVVSAIAVPPLSASSILALKARDRIDRERISLDHRYSGDGALAAVQSNVYFQDSETKEFSAEDRNTSADRTRDNRFDNKAIGFATQFTSELSGAFDQEWNYGVEMSRTRQRGLRDGTVPPVGESFPTRAFPTTDVTLAGLFVQDEFSVRGLRLFPALRFDYFSLDPRSDSLFTAALPKKQHDTHLSPKLGGLWQINDFSSVFVNIGAGFKAPSASQVNNGFMNPIFNYRSISNPELRPETSTSVETGLRVRGEGASASFSVFTSKYQDFIDQAQISGDFSADNPAVFQYVNIGRVRISGAEVKGRALFAHGFSANLGASYTRGSTRGDGEHAPLNSIQPWKLVLGLNWENTNHNMGGQLIATHSGGKQSSRVDESVCTTTCFTPPSFTILDLTAWWNVTNAVSVRGGVFNLTDKRYWWWSDVRGQNSTSTTLAAYTQPERNASVSLSIQL